MKTEPGLASRPAPESAGSTSSVVRQGFLLYFDLSEKVGWVINLGRS